MPPRKRSSSKKKKEEVLPDPDTVSNGNCDYYIGSWSSYCNIDAITEIAHSVLESHTAENGEVKPLPRTNVIIPPSRLGETKMHYVVEVADNMHIESLSRARVCKNDENKEGLLGKEGSVEIQNDAPENSLEDPPEKPPEDSALEEQDVGATQQACDVIIAGAVHIDGIITRIVVKPDLPEPPVVPKVKRKSSTSKKKAKLFEDEQKRLAEEARIYEEKVNAALAAAEREEEYRMQFAHPDRWSKVVFANMTFSGQVIVSHAHVTFMNCRFSAYDPNCTQLLVAQYCQVECVKCTFECPAKGAVYCFPMGVLTLRSCLFTGNPLGFLFEKRTEELAGEVQVGAGVFGLQTDSCKVRVERCNFTCLGTAITLRGSHKTTSSEGPTMLVQKCKIMNIYGTGIVLEKVRGVELRKNEFTDCGYYALDCVRGKDIFVFENTFYSKVRVRDGAHVKLLHNNSGVVPFFPMEVENPNWQPVY